MNIDNDIDWNNLITSIIRYYLLKPFIKSKGYKGSQNNNNY